MSEEVLRRLTVFAIATGVELAAAVAVYPALRGRRRVRGACVLLASAVVLGTPLLIPPGARLLRLLASILAVTLAVKLYDLLVGAARGAVPTFPQFLAFLPNIFSLVHRRIGLAPRPSRGKNLRRLAAGGAAVAAAAALFAVVFRVDWSRHGFAAEHAAKVVALFLIIVALTHALGGAWALLGGRGLAFMDNPFAARTPADFWRRYNRPTHELLREDVFVPAGGRRHGLRGALLVFLVSAAVHEYVFSVPIGRVQGYQTAFFLLQGAAVALTLRLKPRGPVAAAAAVTATFGFNLVTAVLFFASVDELLPFYRNAVPVWR